MASSSSAPGSRHISDLVEEAKPAVFWTDHSGGPTASEPLSGKHHADLVIVGGGFTGLWSALQALEENPGRRVVVLEAQTTGFGASSRNGGFCDSSLTHGIGNGHSHWPDDMTDLLRMGDDNLAGLVRSMDSYNMKTSRWETDEVTMATAQWHLEELREGLDLDDHYGVHSRLLDQTQARSIANSPTYLGGLSSGPILLLDPGQLVWDLRKAVQGLGGIIHDHSRVTGVEPDGSELVVFSESTVGTKAGILRCERVIVATNAWAEPGKRIRNYVLPIYDHVLTTEPLSDAQMASIGWSGREGLADAGNQFHYYRLTADSRILWGGYDANYYFRNGMGAKYESRSESHKLIAGHFFDTFPQLEGLRFSHRWAGPIGTTSKFTAAFGRQHQNRLAWVAGYTGLGVGASRFGARVALDLIDGKDTERTELAMVRKKPVPIPPEPLRCAVVAATRRAIIRSDANHGRRGPWLSLLDRFGVGFDS